MVNDPFVDLFDGFSDRDAENVRCIELENGNKINIKRTDPYGLWRVSYAVGKVPQELGGWYTDINRAIKAVEVYLNQKGKRVRVEDSPRAQA